MNMEIVSDASKESEVGLYIEHLRIWNAYNCLIKSSGKILSQDQNCYKNFLFVKSSYVNRMRQYLRRGMMKMTGYKTIFQIVNNNFVDLDMSCRVVNEDDFDRLSVWKEAGDFIMVRMFDTNGNDILSTSKEYSSRTVIEGVGTTNGYNTFNYYIYDRNDDMFKMLFGEKGVEDGHDCGRVMCGMGMVDSERFCDFYDENYLQRIDVEKNSSWECNKCGWRGVFEINMDVKKLMRMWDGKED